MKINTAPYPVHLGIVTDITVFNNKYEKLKGYAPDIDSCKGYTTYYGNRVLIGVFAEPLHTLIHELNHFCLWTFDYIGMPVNSANSEAYCYYYDYIFNQAYKLVDK